MPWPRTFKRAPTKGAFLFSPKKPMGIAWPRRVAVASGRKLRRPTGAAHHYGQKKSVRARPRPTKKSEQRTPNTKHQTPNRRPTRPCAEVAADRPRSFNQAPKSSRSGNFDQKWQIPAFAFAFAAVPAMGGQHVLAIVGAATATHPDIQSLLQIREAGASAFDLIDHVSLAHPGAHAYDHFHPFPCEASWRQLALTKQRE